MSEKPEVVKIEFEVAPFAVEFLEDYLKFLGSKNTVEDVAREAFFEEICAIRDTVRGLTHYDNDLFFYKYPYVGLLENREELNRQHEAERQSDC